jgi:hypothetical protein
MLPGEISYLKKPEVSINTIFEDQISSEDTIENRRDHADTILALFRKSIDKKAIYDNIEERCKVFEQREANDAVLKMRRMLNDAEFVNLRALGDQGSLYKWALE